MIKPRIDVYKENKRLKEEGKTVGAPIYNQFPRLGEYLPALPKGIMVEVTANSGIGKTQVWKMLFIWTIWIYYKTHPNSGFKPRWILFLLEESKDEFIDSLVSSLLWYRYGISIDPMHLKSMYKEALSSDILAKVEDVQDEVEEMLAHMHIEDGIYNPTGMYKYCRKISKDLGTHYFTKLFEDDGIYITQAEYEVLTPDERSKYKYAHYTATNPDEYKFVITDHLSLLSPEMGLDLHATISKWCVEYCRKQISKHWNYLVINIHQQASDQEKQQYTHSGGNIIDKVKPTLSGLANNKEVQRDHLIVLGLFAPARYGISNYMNYDIKRLEDRFRTLIVLKNRIGKTNLELPLYFNGACSYFKELPKPEDMVDALYDKLLNDNITNK